MTAFSAFSNPSGEGLFHSLKTDYVPSFCANFSISLFPWVRIREIENSNELPRCSAINLCISSKTVISTDSSHPLPTLEFIRLTRVGSRKGKGFVENIQNCEITFYLSKGICDQQLIIPEKQTTELRVLLVEDFSLPVPFEL